MQFTWTDPTITPDLTRIKKSHIVELRQNIQSVQNSLDAHIGSRNQHPIATPSEPGFLSALDKVKLDGITNLIDGMIESGSINSVSGSAPISIDTASPTNPIISIPAAGDGVNGYMTKEMWAKLDGIQAGAQVNPAPHPADHPASFITTDTTRRFVSDEQISRIPSTAQIVSWTAKQEALANASQEVAGLMSAEDKTKVDTLDAFPTGTVIMYSVAHSVGNKDISYYFDNAGSPHVIQGGNPFAKWKWLTGAKDRFPIGASTTHPNGSTGGENAFVIKSKEIPVHSHYFQGDDQLLTGAKGTMEQVTDGEVANAVTYGHSGILKTIDYDAKSQGGYGKGYKTREFEERGTLHNNKPQYIALDFIVKVMD